MKKKVTGTKAYFAIGWSPLHDYNRILAARKLPELPGIVMFYIVKGSVKKPLFAFATWRDGLREGVRNLFDSHFSKCKPIIQYSDNPELHYSFTVIDTNKKDMRDIYYWVLRNYRPEMNTLEGFTHTGRYSDISVYEVTTTNPVEKLSVPGFH